MVIDMKKSLLIVGIICLLLFAIDTLIFKDAANTKKQTPVEQSNTTFPKEENAPAPETVPQPTQSAQKILDNNFLQKDNITEDTSNPGSFYLGNTFQKNETGSLSNYVVTYSQDTQFFNVTLLAEPLRDSRLAAEQYLRSLLGLSDADMCALHYTVSAPQYVSQQYSGNDLKFSFCPGSTSL
jgi:hypothetical protein